MKASVSRAVLDVVLDVKQDSGFSASDVTLVRRLDETERPVNTFDPLESGRGEVTPELGDVVKPGAKGEDRKSTRLNSSHLGISPLSLDDALPILDETERPVNTFDPLESGRGEVTPELGDVVKPGAKG